jgi:hypothetical protein
MKQKRKYTFSEYGRYSLQLHAEFSKCIYCGKFISTDNLMDKEVCGWYDPTGPMDWEPREKLPYHKACQNKEKNGKF